jgi:hypothetical protein
MNIQWVRLEAGVCEIVNRIAEDQRRRVSEVVNEILKEHLEHSELHQSSQISETGA